MDPALRQRLIGAAVLILLAVIFVPMLLDGPPPAVDTREVPLEIPPQPTETRRLPVQPAPLEPGLGEREPAAPAQPQAATGTASVAAVPDGPAAVSSTPVAAAAPATANTPQTPTPAAAPAPPASAPDGASAASAAAGRYVVRFGSFGDQANADRLVRRLQALGVSATVEPVQAGERTLKRVVSSGLPDRAAAEQMRLAVRKAMPELSPQVAELDLPQASASRVAQPVVTGWAVQVGVFSTTAAAEQMVAQLRGDGQEAYFERMPSNGKVLYRVRVGPLSRRADADAAAAAIKRKRKLDVLVVTYP